MENNNNMTDQIKQIATLAVGMLNNLKSEIEKKKKEIKVEDLEGLKKALISTGMSVEKANEEIKKFNLNYNQK